MFPVRFFSGVLAFALLCFTAPRDAQAQFIVRSRLSWQTIETPHFAFHYPTELEAWTRDIAQRMESIDSAVSRLVGYHVPRKTHVVVDDPYAASNGSAWPFINMPIVNMWASPPSPREDIGNFRSWGEILATHEFAHITHLVRPSRNTPFRLLWQTLPVDLGPIAIKAPRWVTEGYATYVEGHITGSGRPYANWRPALLREWAIEGQVPTYEQLNGSAVFQGGDFAYMFGSAYLEWLAGRAGDSSLVALWRRMSARRNRGFDEAFVGVFGETARTLYGRFSAELTAKSMEIARRLSAAGADTGAIVQRLSWYTGDPAISPDGKRVALVLRSPTRPPRLVIWSTSPEPDTLRARRDSALLRLDPEDVPARSIYAPPKKVLATLHAVAGTAFQGPRFLADGRVLTWRYTTRGDGSSVPDLYIWNPSDGRVARITRGASVRDPDPAPDGRSAVAAQCRGGHCDVVRVSLVDGRVEPIARGTPRRSYYRPRFAPAGDRIAVAVQGDNRWRVALVDPVSGVQRFVDPDDGANRYDVAWMSPTTLVAVSESSGIANIETINLESGATRTLTNVTGAAVAAAVNPADGSIWFLSLYSRGYDLRRIASPSQGRVEVAALGAQLAPAIRLIPRDSVLFGAGPVSPPRRFSLATRLYRWLPAPQVDANGAGGVIAVSTNDLVGKTELLLQFALGGHAAWRGGSLSTSWRIPWATLRFDGFGVSQRPSLNAAEVLVPAVLDARLAGGTALVAIDAATDEWRMVFRAGTTVSHVSHFTSPDTGAFAPSTRALSVTDLAASWQRRGDTWRAAAGVTANAAMGWSSDESVARFTVAVAATVGAGGFPALSASGQFGRVNNGATPFELFAIGGLSSPIIDRAVLSQRIVMPVLPTGTDVGTSLFVYRVSMPLGAITPYWWTASTTYSNGSFVRWHRIVGAEWTTSVPAYPLAGTPAARAQVGIGRSLDPPFQNKYRGYASLIFTP